MEKGTTTDAARQAERDLWREYHAARDPKLRDRLIVHYLDVAHKIAASVFRHRVHNAVGFDDYLQYARVGLLQAVDRFSPDGEANFETFAGYRIRGAILNGLDKSTEWAAQAAQQRRLRLRERAESLRSQAPDQAEGQRADAFADLVDATLMLAMGYVIEDTGHEPASIAAEADPYRVVQLDHLRRLLRLIVEALPERERQIVRYHYFEHMEFQAIAELLHVTKGRISQLHARAMRLIRDGFAAFERFDLEL